jgi:hypothetical protein
VTLIQPDVTLHDSRGHRWRTAPGYQDREPHAPGWLLLQRQADGVEMPYDRVVDVFGYGQDGERYLLGRYDHAAADHHARLAAGTEEG